MRELEHNAMYRHYGGDYYYVIGEGIHTETEEPLVAYHALYGDKKLYFRPKDMFMSEAPQNEKNVTGQPWRFMSYAELETENAT